MKKIFLMLLSTLALLTGCTTTGVQEAKSTVLDAIESPVVQSIKAMTLDGSDYKIGDLVDASMGSPTYELYDPAEDGNIYVTVKGNITYADVPVVATLQYKKLEDEHYEFYTLCFNEVPQTNLVVGQFFDFLVKSYEATQSKINGSQASVEDKLLKYVNSKFAFEIDYPESWGEVEESQNGDGVVLLMDDYYDIRVYASYLVTEPDFETYMGANYNSWMFSEINVEGSEQAYKVEYSGEESYQFAIVAFANDTVYTYSAVRMLMTGDLGNNEAQFIKNGEMSEAMIESFKVLQ